MCQCEQAVFKECGSCCTCLEVAAEIKHIGVKECQSASQWQLFSISWQCSGRGPGPGMLCPSVNTELRTFAGRCQREDFCSALNSILYPLPPPLRPRVHFITWPGERSEDSGWEARVCRDIISLEKALVQMFVCVCVCVSCKETKVTAAKAVNVLLPE